MFEISAHYVGPLNNDKELELYSQLKAHAAEQYPTHMIAGSRFEVTGEGPAETHTHYLRLVPPQPKDATQA